MVSVRKNIQKISAIVLKTVSKLINFFYLSINILNSSRLISVGVLIE